GPREACLVPRGAKVGAQRRGFLRSEKPVLPRGAEPRHFTHADHAQPGFGLHFFFDLLVEGAPLFSARSRRCSSTCCKARFKKSISMACWPTLRSSSATRLSSARLLPTPLNACSPCSCNSRRQRCSSLGFTSNARATSAMLCPLSRRRTAVCLNSFVNFLRDFILPVSPFDDFQGLTGCLKNGVHSTAKTGWLLFLAR